MKDPSSKTMKASGSAYSSLRRLFLPHLMTSRIAKAFGRSPFLAASVALGMVLLIGFIDYVTGYEISVAVFYLLAIALAVWFVGVPYATVISVFSVTVSLVSDIAAGASYSNRLVPIWNAGITGTFYLLFVWLLGHLKVAQEELEKNVRDRTVELTAEMTRRQMLEEELLFVSEREQQRIGHDLHDSLCQHLTAAALAGQVLEEKLAARSAPEITDTQRVVKLIEEGIDIARSVARGLFPTLLEKQGVMSALDELVVTTSELSGVECLLESEAPVMIQDSSQAAHLFRIAQEAVRNAVKHSGARKVVIGFTENEKGILLTVTDDGRGISPYSSGNKGMGLQIMRHRAAMIGGVFDLRSDSLGTVVTCQIAEKTPDGSR
jgi:signal transduction histidine kinase